MTANKKRSKKRNRPPQKRPRWSREEFKLFRRLHARTPNREIARLLGRSLQGISSQAHKLGMKKAMARLVLMGKENIAHRWKKKRRTRRRV